MEASQVEHQVEGAIQSHLAKLRDVAAAFGKPSILLAARSIATWTRSTPVAVHPCRARYATSFPVPHPRSSARPGGNGVLPSTSSTTSGGVTPVSHGVRPVR